MSAIPGPFKTGTVATTASGWYLHELTLAQGTAWGNVESTKTSAVMQSNGIEGVMTGGALATINNVETGWGYSWPITLVRDTNRSLLTSPLNLNTRHCRMAILERTPTPTGLPNEAGMVFGFCDNVDPIQASNRIAIGLAWKTTTLRSCLITQKRAGTQAFVTAGTGQSTCFGSECDINVVGAPNSNGTLAKPLDSAFLHASVGSNTATQAANNFDVSAMTHIFCAFVYTVAVSIKTPTIRCDFGLKIAPDMPWA